MMLKILDLILKGFFECLGIGLVLSCLGLGLEFYGLGMMVLSFLGSIFRIFLEIFVVLVQTDVYLCCSFYQKIDSSIVSECFV